MKKALLIGINYLQFSELNGRLNGCINDTIHMRNYLMEKCGFQNDAIVILSEVSKNKQPTKANIIQWMKWLVKDNTADSRLFLHYSGHGSYLRDINGDETDKRDETICPLDYETAGFIVDDELRDILVEPLVKGAILTCVFDNCFSGTILDLRCNWKILKNGHFDIYLDKHYKETTGQAILLSGCLDSQTSADAYEENKFQGAMTYSLLKSLEKAKEKNKPLTYYRLMKYLTDFIRGKGYTQIPQLSTGRMMNFNDVFSII